MEKHVGENDVEIVEDMGPNQYAEGLEEDLMKAMIAKVEKSRNNQDPQPYVSLRDYVIRTIIEHIERTKL